MKTPDYQLKLRELAPSVVFSVEWSHDVDARWPKDCGERGDFMPYNTDVTARAIVNGEYVEGDACMGGTWEIPGKIDPEIGGYLPQMLEEAAGELMARRGIPLKIKIELRAVIAFLKALMTQRWEKQQKEMSAITSTKSGIVAALIQLGFRQDEGPFPPSLKTVAPAATFTADEMSFAEYMVADGDFGGCWNDAEQINMHTVNE